MKHHSLHSRSGALIIAVMACLTLVTLLTGVWMKLIATEHRQIRAQANTLQAEILAEAAVARADARLQSDPAYTGETWDVPATAFGANPSQRQQAAKVTIQVTPLAAKTAAEPSPTNVESAVPIAKSTTVRLVSVVAEYPAEGNERVRRSKQQQAMLSPIKEPMP